MLCDLPFPPEPARGVACNMQRIRMQRAAPGQSPKDATLSALQSLRARGVVTAESLTAECLACIATHDQRGARLAAIRCLNPHAENEARRLDSTLHAKSGPLQGMPVILKDNIDMVGLPTTSGNEAMAHAVPLRDAGQTARLRRAGAVLLGKANLSEFSFEIRSRSTLGGDVRNPFDRRVTAGGSSGGTAVAVAAGFAVAGVGTDTGGSIRVPAAFTGLVGLRPTWGLIDASGIAPLAPSTDTVGPIARSVEDIATLLGVMTGTPRARWLPDLAAEPVPVTPARIGVFRQAFGSNHEIRDAMEHALAALASAGTVIVEGVELPADVLPIDRPHVVDWEFGPAFDAYLRSNFVAGTAPGSLATIYADGRYLAEYRDTLRKRLEVRSLDEPTHREILAYHMRLRDALSALMERFALDALVYPTSAVIPTSLDNPKSGWAAELAACAGWPALTLPVGQSRGGIPVGFEFLGRARSEASLLALAEKLESLVGGSPIPNLDAF